MIRHAESAPDPKVPEPDWPLSERGQRQAIDLVDALAPLPVTRIVSSPYPRALATVKPFALTRYLEIDLEADLRERKLTEDPNADWQALLRAAWQDFDRHEPNCESSAMCQARVRHCLSIIAARHAGETIVAASHGNAIALMLTSIDPDFGYAGWRSMRNPDAFMLSYEAGDWHWHRGYRLAKL
jgi:2,3-bisphosphoglycerate-dependent phosphoglycerate mutase